MTRTRLNMIEKLRATRNISDDDAKKLAVFINKFGYGLDDCIAWLDRRGTAVEVAPPEIVENDEPVFPSMETLRREFLCWSQRGTKIHRYEIPASIKLQKRTIVEKCFCGESLHPTNVKGFTGCKNGHFHTWEGSVTTAEVLAWQHDREGMGRAEEIGEMFNPNRSNR